MTEEQKRKMREYSRRYYQTHREKLLARQKARYREDPGHYIEYSREYYRSLTPEDREHMRKRSREYYRENREEILARRKGARSGS